MLAILIGFFSGILGGMGVGGGMLLIPAARIFMGLSQQAAQALNLYCFIPASACAIFIHLKNGRIDVKKALPIILTGVPLSLLGAYISTHISSLLLSRLFGGFILIFGIREIIYGIKSSNK